MKVSFTVRYRTCDFYRTKKKFEEVPFSDIESNKATKPSSLGKEEPGWVANGSTLFC
jgi:hypothetical protein